MKSQSFTEASSATGRKRARLNLTLLRPGAPAAESTSRTSSSPGSEYGSVSEPESSDMLDETVLSSPCLLPEPPGRASKWREPDTERRRGRSGWNATDPTASAQMQERRQRATVKGVQKHHGAVTGPTTRGGEGEADTHRGGRSNGARGRVVVRRRARADGEAAAGSGVRSRRLRRPAQPRRPQRRDRRRKCPRAALG